MDNFMRVPFRFDKASIYNIQEINESFATGTLRVMYLGGNRNGSYFSKEAVEDALETLPNVPIVAHWDEEAGEIGGHDVEVARDGNGTLRLRNLTQPCGVVPDHAKFYFETGTDENGAEHEYLVVDGVILWKRQDVYAYITENLGGKVNHSMEITVKDGETTKRGYEIKRFAFTALCLLERDEPCFEGSELSLYSAANFKAKMEEMLAELRECYSEVYPNGVDDIHPQNYTTEGGEKVLEEKANVIEKEMEEKEVETVAQTDNERAEEPVADTPEEAPADDDEDGAAGFALTGNITDELRREVGRETYTDEWGYTERRYWYVESDFEKREVYVHDASDWRLYAFTYAVDGDAVKIDYNSKRRMKYVIADFEGGEESSWLSEIFAMFGERLGQNADLQKEYQTASDTIKTMEKELGELRQFKSDTEFAKAKSERDAVFALFEDLVGVEAFEALRSNCDGMSPEEVEEKCYAIRGRNTAVKFNAESKAPKQKIDRIDKHEDEPYGDLFTRYGSAK